MFNNLWNIDNNKGNYELKRFYRNGFYFKYSFIERGDIKKNENKSFSR